MEVQTFKAFEIDELFDQCGNLGSAIGMIEERLKENGHVLCEIKVNGMALTPIDEEKYSSATRDQIQSLELKSESTAELIKSSRTSVQEYLTQLKEVSLLVSERTRAEGFGAVSEAVSQVLQGAQWVTDMLNQLKLLDSTGKSLGKEWRKAEDQLLAVGRDLVDAFERKDMIALADSLEYEWTNSLENWICVLRDLDQQNNERHNDLNGTNTQGQE